MKRNKLYILNASMILFQFYSSLPVYGSETYLIESESSIGFTGVYESTGMPDPEPGERTGIDSLKEVTNSSQNVSNTVKKYLPKTNSTMDNRLLLMGGNILAIFFVIWLGKKQKKKARNDR